MLNSSLKERFDICAQSLEALNRMRSKQDVLAKENASVKKDYSRLVFEEYNDDYRSIKITGDSIFYNCLTNRLDNIHEDDMQILFTNLTHTMNSIYEHINIKPKVYGFSESEIQNESEDVLHNKAVHIITEFLNYNYYTLSKEQLSKLYLKDITTIARDLIITETLDTNDAVQFALKSLIIESLIEKINFPMTVQDKINELMISNEYKAIFDQDRLINLWETFQNQSRDIAKIVTTVV